MHPLAQWELICPPVDADAGPAPFVRPSMEGALPPAQFRQLCHLLAAHTTTADRCFVALWEGYSSVGAPLVARTTTGDRSSVADWRVSAPVGRQAFWAAGTALRLEERTFIVAESPVEAAASIGGPELWGRFRDEPPTLMWPEDHAWFVACDPDLDSTYVGGTVDLIMAILAAPDLEAWPAQPDDDVSLGSDEINLPRS